MNDQSVESIRVLLDPATAERIRDALGPHPAALAVIGAASYPDADRLAVWMVPTTIDRANVAVRLATGRADDPKPPRRRRVRATAPAAAPDDRCAPEHPDDASDAPAATTGGQLRGRFAAVETREGVAATGRHWKLWIATISTPAGLVAAATFSTRLGDVLDSLAPGTPVRFSTSETDRGLRLETLEPEHITR